MIIRLIRISIAYKYNLNNHQHFHILQTINTIARTDDLKIVLKLEILNYLRHVGIKYFTVEYQNEILKSIRQLFKRYFIDLDPIVKQVAFSIYAQVMAQAQHDAITIDDITDDESLKTELYNFIEMKTTLSKADEQMKFTSELSSYWSKHECPGTKVSVNDDDDNGFQRNHLKEIQGKEIIDRIQSDTKLLMALNENYKFRKEFYENIANIIEQLALIK